VLIGEESDLTSELDFSLVAAPYRVGERTLGTLGIVGPSRMDYEKIIPLVHYLGETLSRALSESFSGPETR
jgi:heat-inducible transcriptional repressor